MQLNKTEEEKRTDPGKIYRKMVSEKGERLHLTGNQKMANNKSFYVQTKIGKQDKKNTNYWLQCVQAMSQLFKKLWTWTGEAI